MRQLILSVGLTLLFAIAVGCSRTSLAPTPSLAKEWDLEKVRVDSSTVSVELHVVEGAEVSVTIDGRDADNGRSTLPSVEYVFEDTAPGRHILEVQDAVGYSETEVAMVPGPSVPECMAKLIPRVGNEHVANPPASITSYEYQEQIKTLAPIGSVEVLTMESFPVEYMLAVESGLPDSCTTFAGYNVQRTGTLIRVEVINYRPGRDSDLGCAQVYETMTTRIPLGIDFEPGQTYSVEVNDVKVNFVSQYKGSEGVREDSEPNLEVRSIAFELADTLRDHQVDY